MARRLKLAIAEITGVWQVFAKPVSADAKVATQQAPHSLTSAAGEAIDPCINTQRE